jgi:hypothetical protein
VGGKIVANIFRIGLIAVGDIGLISCVQLGSEMGHGFPIPVICTVVIMVAERRSAGRFPVAPDIRNKRKENYYQ